MADQSFSEDELIGRAARMWARAVRSRPIAPGDTLTVQVPISGGLDERLSAALVEALGGLGVAVGYNPGTESSFTLTRTNMWSGEGAGSSGWQGSAQGTSEAAVELPAPDEDSAADVARDIFDLIAVLGERGQSGPSVELVVSLLALLVSILDYLK